MIEALSHRIIIFLVLALIKKKSDAGCCTWAGQYIWDRCSLCDWTLSPYAAIKRFDLRPLDRSYRGGVGPVRAEIFNNFEFSFLSFHYFKAFLLISSRPARVYLPMVNKSHFERLVFASA